MPTAVTPTASSNSNYVPWFNSADQGSKMLRIRFDAVDGSDSDTWTPSPAIQGVRRVAFEGDAVGDATVVTYASGVFTFTGAAATAGYVVITLY